MRLKDRVARKIGAGQSPGEGIGNGRATALTLAREGAKVLGCRSQSGLRPGDGRSDRRRWKAPRRRSRPTSPRLHTSRRWWRMRKCAKAASIFCTTTSASACPAVACRVARHFGGSARPLRGDQPEELRVGRQACHPDHAGGRRAARSSTSRRWPRSPPILLWPTRRPSRR